MTINEIIKEKYDSLSKGQRKVVDYLLKDIVGFSMSTASQIAKQASVSETTVIRLSYALDFESFSQMQKHIQKEFLSKKEGVDTPSKQELSSDKDFIDSFIENEISILKSIRNNLDMKNYWMAIEKIIEADEVKIVGYRASYSAANWLFLRLNMLRRNVELVSSNSTNYPDNLLLEPDLKTVFIFISLPSYATQSLEVARVAKAQGATLITVTDHILSPVSRISDISFTTQINDNSWSFIPISSVMSLLHIITAGIETKYQSQVTNRLLKLQNLYQDREFFIE